MTTTTFANGTVIEAAWLNDVNSITYTFTGTGNTVKATSPTLTTPILGVATATSINKVAITAPATSATLAIADGATLATSGAYSVTLTATGATSVTLPTTGTLATTATATDGFGALTDVTTNNVSATAHGFCPKYPNNTTTFLRGDGTYAGAGGMVLLSTVTASSSSTVDVETTWSSTYSAYILVASGVVPSVDGANLQMLMKIGGSYLTTATYYWNLVEPTSTSTAFAGGAGSGDTKIKISEVINNTSGGHCNFTLHAYNPSSTSLIKMVHWTGVSFETGATRVTMNTGSGGNSGTSALTGLRFQCSSGNITSGTFRLYGILNS